MFLAIAAILLTLILVVGVHEMGHALAARIAHVTITKVSIGFGKPLIQWRSKTGCQWIWALWPLGGYVQLLNTRISPVSPEQLPYCFDKKPVWVRVFILMSGSVVNLLTAWLALVLVFFIGINYKFPLIQSVQLNSVADKAGVLPGDQVIAIENHKTRTFYDVGMRLIEFWGKQDLKINMKEKDGELKLIHLDLSKIQLNPRQKSLFINLGMIPNFNSTDVLLRYPSLSESMFQSFVVIIQMIGFFLIILKQLITGTIPFAVLLGPLGLFASSIQSLMQGFVIFIHFIASLSIAIALVNLFPIPGLDGGSIIYAIIEKIRGKPLSIAFEVLMHRLVFIALCLLLVQLTLNDLKHLFL